jgi:hypothetical protein
LRENVTGGADLGVGVAVPKSDDDLRARVEADERFDQGGKPGKILLVREQVPSAPFGRSGDHVSAKADAID